MVPPSRRAASAYAVDGRVPLPPLELDLPEEVPALLARSRGRVLCQEVPEGLRGRFQLARLTRRHAPLGGGSHG